MPRCGAALEEASQACKFEVRRAAVEVRGPAGIARTAIEGPCPWCYEISYLAREWSLCHENLLPVLLLRVRCLAGLPPLASGTR